MDEPPLTVGSEVRCPRCRLWHQAVRIHTGGTPYTVAMLYVLCRGLRFYVGNEGTTSRHATQPPPSPRRIGPPQVATMRARRCRR